LKYGKIKTHFHHYTVLLDVFAEKEVTDYNSNVCPEGNAWMGVKVWANDADEAADIACTFARSIGLEINTSNNSIQIFDTKPEMPPQEKPFAYDSNFSPYDE
jgi:peroxiredoxin